MFTGDEGMDRTLFNINRLESLIQLSGPSADRISKTEAIFTQICRTCLCETTDNNLEENLCLTNDTNGTSITIKGVLEASTGLEVNLEDKLPHHVCNGCMTAIETAYSFRTQSQRINEILKGLLKRMQAPNETHIEGESVPCTDVVSIKSEKIDEPTDIVQIEDYQVSYVKEGCGTSDFQSDSCNVNLTNLVDPEKHETECVPGTSKKKPFKCGICSKEFVYRNGLHNHLMNNHIYKKQYSCPICFKHFKKREGLENHKKTICIAPNPISKLGRATSEIIIYPIEDSTEPGDIPIEIRNFSCSLCDGTFELETDFNSHLQEHSTNKICPYCKKNFSRAIYLETHIRSHTGEKPFVCPLCLTGFVATRTLRNHIKLHTTRDAFICNTCGRKYFSERELLRHIKTHALQHDLDESKTEEAICAEGISLKPNDCKESVLQNEPVCTPDLKPIKKNDLSLTPVVKNEMVYEHIDRAYKTESNICTNTPASLGTPAQSLYVVPNIAMVFSPPKVPNDQPIFDQTPDGFEITIKEENSDDDHSPFNVTNEPLSDDEGLHDQSKQKPTKMSPASEACGKFTCVIPDCNKEFRYYRDIINHYTLHHCTGPPPFKCPLCEKVLLIKSEVRRHVKTHLKCEYKCEHCPRSYWQLRDLKHHLRTHTGERPFKCTKCPKRFKQRPALKVHINTHNLSKEYKCNFCPKEFFSYNGLFLHAKSHIAIKELQCDMCTKQFPTKSRLRRHQSCISCIRPKK